MARRLRVEFSGAIYHVVSRGDRREPIFHDDDDRDKFVATMGEACGKTQWQIHAFCLMPNHFHLVLETPQPNLVAGMKWFLGTYTARFNRRHKLTGHLFSGRYKSLIVSGTGGYLRKVCEYVHLNPARANLLKPHEPLRVFHWSSFPLYLQTPSERPYWLRLDRVFGETGIRGDTPADRLEFERQMEGLRRQEPEAGFEAIRKGWALGDDQFRKGLMAQVTLKAGLHHYGEEIRESAEEKAYGIIDRELKRLTLSEQDLRQTRRGDPRKVEIALKIRAQTTVTLNWIADRLHMGTRGYLAHLLYWRGRRSREKVTTRTVSTQTVAIAPDSLSLGFTQFDPSFD